MALPVQTVREFLNDSCQLISASSPTVPLQGNDQSKALQILNQLIKHYSATGTLNTIAKRVDTTVQLGQQYITYGDASYVPTPDVPFGRLSNIQNAWLTLDGVTYPIWDESRNTFLASYKYEPLQGLPRFGIIFNETNLTRVQIYPAPSQEFEFSIYGKFEMSSLDINDTMEGFPLYYIMFFQFAVARWFSFYKGRSSAWTQKLENLYTEARDEMLAVTPVNLNIETDYESLLNGAWRVRSGV